MTFSQVIHIEIIHSLLSKNPNKPAKTKEISIRKIWQHYWGDFTLRKTETQFVFPEQPLLSHSANIRKCSEVNTAQYMAQKYNIICTESAKQQNYSCCGNHTWNLMTFVYVISQS